MRKDEKKDIGIPSSFVLNEFRKLRGYIKWESCRRNPDFQKEYKEWKRNHRARMSKSIIPQDTEDPELINLLKKWADWSGFIHDPTTYPDAKPFPECFYHFKPVDVINLHKTVKFFVDENLKWQKGLIRKFGSEENILRNADLRTLKSYLKGESPIPYPTESADELIVQIDITKPIKYLIPYIKSEISRAQQRMRQNALILVCPNGQEIRLSLDGKVLKFEKTREEFKKMFKVWDCRKRGKLIHR